jgi:hypothetical protein
VIASALAALGIERAWVSGWSASIRRGSTGPPPSSNWGPGGALSTEGWDRHVVATGEAAKRSKRLINGERIYPPLSGGRAAILAAAAPLIQRPPPIHP